MDFSRTMTVSASTPPGECELWHNSSANCLFFLVFAPAPGGLRFTGYFPFLELSRLSCYPVEGSYSPQHYTLPYLQTHVLSALARKERREPRQTRGRKRGGSYSAGLRGRPQPAEQKTPQRLLFSVAGAVRTPLSPCRHRCQASAPIRSRRRFPAIFPPLPKKQSAHHEKLCYHFNEMFACFST